MPPLGSDMGYFSNGIEGVGYREKWCDRCIHDNDAAGIYCPVWTLHLAHNYEGANDKGHFLHSLIPQSADGLSNERCTMFIDRGLLSNLQIQRFESDRSAIARAVKAAGKERK